MMKKYQSKWIRKDTSQTLIIWFPGLNDTYSHDEQIENAAERISNLDFDFHTNGFL